MGKRAADFAKSRNWWGGDISNLIMSPEWFWFESSMDTGGRVMPSCLGSPGIPQLWDTPLHSLLLEASVHPLIHFTSSPSWDMSLRYSHLETLERVDKVSRFQHPFSPNASLASLWFGALSSLIESTNLYWKSTVLQALFWQWDHYGPHSQWGRKKWKPHKCNLL